MVELCNPPHPYEGRNIFAPASVGVAFGESDPARLLRNAELALAAAKSRGGACALVYEQSLESQARADAVALEADLRQALDEGQIELFYQPIMRLSDRAVAGFEALLRWRHPARGLITPADFIAHSEETGLIVTLGRLRAGTSGQRSLPLAALFPAVAALVRQRQSFPPAIARSRFRRRF